MRILQFGAGRVGSLLADLIHQDNHDIVVCDILPEEIFDECPWKYITCNNGDFQGVIDHTKPSLVMSCLPYKYNLDLGTHCIKNNMMYADLGGHEETSNKLRALAKKNNSHIPIALDLGLAPGLVNILGVHYADMLDVEHLSLYCGGLPHNKDINELGYQVTFSPEGLLNEYYERGITTADSMFELELESFLTHGGLGSLKEYNSIRFYYRTLRYPGHKFKFDELYDEYGHEGMLSLLRNRYTYDHYDDFVVIALKTTKDVFRIKNLEAFKDHKLYYFDNKDLSTSSLSELTAKGAYWCIEQILDDIVPKNVLNYYDFNCRKIHDKFIEDKCTTVK